MRRHALFWRLVIAVSLAAIVVVMVHGFVTGRRLGDRIGALTAERAALMADKADLESQLAYVQTDAFVLQTARDRLGLVMPGEIRYVAENAPAAPAPEP